VPLACARSGSPLVILTPGGELSDLDQRQELMPFPGKCVRSSGGVYERKGTPMITIKNIEELQHVHLTIADQ
jgi:hypothetical protein